MAKISQLPVLAVPTGAERVPVLDGNRTMQTSLAALVAGTAGISGVHPVLDLAGSPNVLAGASRTVAGLVTGTKVLIRPLAANTGPATFNLNDTGDLPSVHADGGTAMGRGDLRLGYPYVLMFVGGGNVWQIVSYGHARDDAQQGRNDYGEATGTANAIVLTTTLKRLVTPAYRLPFTTGPEANTGPVVVTIDGQGPFPLVKGKNAQLVAGDLPGFTKCEIIFDGLGGNGFALHSVGLQGQSGEQADAVDPLTRLQAIRANTLGISTFVAGVRSTAARRFGVLSTGMSIFRGANLTPQNYPDSEAFNLAHAPVTYFVNRLRDRLGSGFAVDYDNQAIGGSFDDSVPAQFDATILTKVDIWFLGLGMNSGSLFGMHGKGPNAGDTIEKLRAKIRTAKANGTLPIICNTIFPWPEKIMVGDIAGSLQLGINWPPDQATLAFFGFWSFDAAAGTLTGQTYEGLPIFAHGLQGGTKIGVGSKLYVSEAGAGANAGLTLTVEERINDTTVRVGAGQIAQSMANAACRISHFAPPLESIMTEPPSVQHALQDYTGAGIPTPGLRSYALYNRLLDVLARQEEVPIVDHAWRGARWVELHGWQSVYTMTHQGITMQNYNHPVYPAQSVIYGEVLAGLADQFADGTLTAGYHRHRGPAIV